jgi:hypothetical protein
MQNIDKAKVEDIRSNSDKLYSLFNDTDKWVADNLKFEEGETLSIRIKDGRRVVRKIRRSLDSKPVFALFGASQVGKSYLVKNLLSVDGQPLEIMLDGQPYDFLKQINPPGVGAESTGVVTRFSIDAVSINNDFPIRIKLLDVKDIVIIICDGFFSDLKKISEYPSADALHIFLESLEKKFLTRTEEQTVLTEDDVLDIKDYFTRHFFKSQHILDSIDSSKFWLRLCKMISKIPESSWSEAFSILWANQPSLTALFVQMVEGLSKMQFPQVVYAPKETVLRGHGEILDVQRLKELTTSKATSKVMIQSGVIVDVHLCTLSAVSSELTLTISKEAGAQKQFLKNTDLLDFPGARSRLELSIDSITEESVPDMFLRGKVAYLFNKYSGDYEINNLLFCLNDKQLDVNEIPSILYEWISNNIGNTPDEREKTTNKLPVSPLFIVFTFFNNQLKFDTTNDDKENIDYKWKNRFERFFEQEVVTSSYNWHLNWTSKSPVFKNFYLLRDYKYSGDTFYGFEEVGVEKSIREERLQFADKLKESFVNFPFVQRSFDNPIEVWNESALPNSDGSQRIIQNLEPAANNYVKMHNYTVQLSNQRNAAVSRLRKYYHSDNLHEKRRNSLKRSTELQIELNKVFGKNPMLFSLFMNKILLSESDVYNYFHENLSTSRSVETFDEYSLFKSQYPMLKAENSREKNILLLKEQLFYESDVEVERFLEDNGINLDKLFGVKVKTSATSLVFGLFEKWKNNIQYEQFRELISAGLTRYMFDFLVETIVTTIEHLNLQEFLVVNVEKKTQRLDMGREAEEYLASLCANYINDFVINVGFNYMSAERLEELKQIASIYNIDLQTVVEEVAIPDKSRLKDFFNADKTSDSSGSADYTYMIGSYNKFLLKLKLAILSNCGFVNYDVEANDQLSKLLEQMDILNFNLE